MPIVKQNVGNIKAKEKETVSQIKKRGVKGSKIVLSTTASSPTTDSALLTIEPDEADFKLEEKKEAND
ncbi:hypothetical protein Mgra_00006725 [Meloidogyne graminicola]|uniref:Uncharacterized protein n=1 Tax=Meloidogyne graminicola TaxID=189291 RepID=A0A8S9ZL01_9BILA|nr:hypothetical protein Mgra_00006725 [Meloidogyne graminicola]